MSRRRVPTALHRELSEYASLLRALRTRDTMDVTKHLTKPSPFVVSQSEDWHEDEMSDNDNNNNNSRRASSSDELPKQIFRDHWTRWPLLVNDVPKPEWTLEDEVAVVANQVFKAHSNIPFSGSSDESNEGEEEEEEEDVVILDLNTEEDDPEHAFYVPSLTYIISDYLSTILGQIASQTPARPASMQNRIEPLNWRAVIDAVVSCGNPEYSNPKVLSNVIRRMESIYSPSSPSEEDNYRAVERVKNTVAAREYSFRQYENAAAEIFTQASPPLPVQEPPVRPSTIKRKRVISTDGKEKDYVLRTKWKRKERRLSADDGPEDARPVRRCSRFQTNLDDPPPDPPPNI